MSVQRLSQCLKEAAEHSWLPTTSLTKEDWDMSQRDWKEEHQIGNDKLILHASVRFFKIFFSETWSHCVAQAGLELSQTFCPCLLSARNERSTRSVPGVPARFPNLVELPLCFEFNTICLWKFFYYDTCYLFNSVYILFCGIFDFDLWFPV